ncbi:hypothetical protein [Dokdonella soli]|uniref:Uncharacterized protein n=1 Tax=Dokdonella soli TaxID=529810 RepID=A0ABP3TT35_9GAMM
MTASLPATLLQLWSLTGRSPSHSAADWNHFFDPIGLILLAPAAKNNYWCTPLNSFTFAATGGDGVHYGLVNTGSGFTDFSPVVMTVPMCDTPNLIVGANLKEFLSLGCRFGYFALEQLIYNRERTIRELATGQFDPEQEEKERRLLKSITEAFNLKPWANPAARLEELAVAFTATLQLPEASESAA